MAVSFSHLEPYKLSNVKFTDHELGRGSYATIIELKHKGQKCAGKKIHEILLKAGDQSYSICRFEEECRLMSQVHHPNIVEFFGIYFPKGSQIPILVMEFLPINLTYCIEKEDSLPIEMRYSILNDVAQGFFYLHSQIPPIVHRDLTSNNVLLTVNMKAKISDLGVARILNMTPLQVSHMTRTPGTPAYMPPEVMVEKPMYDTSIDKFSYGILMIHIFSGKWPLPQVGQIRTEGGKLIPVSEAERREVFLKAIGDDHPLMDLILRCINNDPELRPLTAEIVEELAKTVQKFPISRPAMLMPVKPKVDKKKKKKYVTDYDYVEQTEAVQESRESHKKLVIMKTEDKEKETLESILSWAQKQLRKAKAFFFMQKPQPKQASTVSKGLEEDGNYPIYVAKDDYKSHADNELSFKKGDELCIVSTDNGNMWLAFSPISGKKGYIPSKYVTEITYPIHAAVFDYESRTDNNLSFKKGDLLYIINTDDKDWWFARSKDSGKEGYVPSNYLTSSIADSDITNTLYVHKWYFGDISRPEAEIMLSSGLNQQGSYLVRSSGTFPGDYVLSIRYSYKMRHYRIRTNENKKVFINSREDFESIIDLVSFYQQQGLQLLYPCIPSEKPQTVGLSKGTWEIDRRQLKFVKKVGSGQFGEVWKALWNKTTTVAVKALKPGAMNPSEFLQEAVIMRKLHHENILQLHAVCTKKEPIYLISEFMQHGSLLEYLRGEGKSSKLTQLIEIATQIIGGMTYLETCNYIHRDLAARNILVGENLICKIADFGLARVIEADFYEIHGKEKLAIKWTAPEAALYNRFTIKSDVWSFGIVLYEIITYGHLPYPGMSNPEVLQKVEQGYRMPQPENCPYQFYNIMLKCWRQEPENRTCFEGLQWEFEECLESL